MTDLLTGHRDITVPTVAGGWWHDYVCPTHGSELTGPGPRGHLCPRGCEIAGPKADAAWLVYEHQGAAREIRRLAWASVHARTGAEDRAELRERAQRMLAEYAEVYAALSDGWSEAGESWMLRGRLFAQALTEAQWAVQVADAVIVLGGEGLDPQVVEMLESLLTTIDDSREILVTDRGDERNNYTAWLNAAGALLARALTRCGRVAHAGRWVERTLDHIELAVHPDGWEWEGAAYYHLFVLRAYLLALRDVRPQEIPAAARRRLAAMIRVLAQVAAPDGRLPALHDGPYSRVPMHREVLEIARLARGLQTPTGLDTVERFARERVGAADDGLESSIGPWFDGEPVEVPRGPATDRGSVLFADAGYAVLRDGEDTFQAVLDAGPHGGAHGHLDKLAVYLYGAAPWQPAPGVPPYASALRRGHYARTVAHPTVRVDGADQGEATGSIDVWDPAAGRVVASAEPFAGVRLRRSLVLGPGYLADVVTVVGDRPHRVSLGLRPATAFGVRATPQGAESEWTDGAATLRGVHVASSPTGSGPAAVVQTSGRGPSDDPAAPQQVADWVADGERVTFASLYLFGAGPGAGPAVRDADVYVTFEPDGATTFHLTTTGPSHSGPETTIEVAP
ncbi:hypothetical protein GCM10025865_12650 [Paraoerskovia sediminicola]|uniref:Heparinase II/III-like C-terminal domain-containing protein n=1 Tax=Paraoerskovia sediminicola TaxID=1138587 RepID=A0ABM8G1P6_9CELL|nr:heparinase II/III family protein [Paraoerskovia sediminicola]BDZ41966.1 hypothetical protein GCM10025865_12650 [Paraoerskovia sediminicola]